MNTVECCSSPRGKLLILPSCQSSAQESEGWDKEQNMPGGKLLHRTYPVVEGDLCKLDTLIRMYERDPDGACLGWGFSRQPFSKLGDGQQGLDSRSATLPFGLFAAHILRKDLLIMECVTEASTSAFVQKCLEYHLKLTLSEKAETFLSLADIWPAKRRRWWTVITKAFMGKVQLNPFPVLPQKPTWSSLLADFRTQASHPISPRV